PDDSHSPRQRHRSPAFLIQDAKSPQSHSAAESQPIGKQSEEVHHREHTAAEPQPIKTDSPQSHREHREESDNSFIDTMPCPSGHCSQSKQIHHRATESTEKNQIILSSTQRLAPQVIMESCSPYRILDLSSTESTEKNAFFRQCNALLLEWL